MNPNFNWDLQVPFGYGNSYVTLRWMNTWLLRHHDPEFVRRIISYLHFKQGNVGVGGGWRAGGQQPDKPGFAPEGRSFHQDQAFVTGFTGAAALDLVYKDGPDAGDAHDYIAWHEIPVQGSAAAHEFGIHANVGVPGNGESWHVQWCDEHRGGYDLDGWGSWVTAGRPGPIPDHPLPPDHDPDYEAPSTPTTSPSKDSDMLIVYKHQKHPEVLIVGQGGVIHADGPIRDAALRAGAEDLRNKSTDDAVYARLIAQAGS